MPQGHFLAPHWRAALLLNAVMLLASMAVFAIPVMAPELARSLEVSPTLLGGYSAILWIASILTITTAGHLISRHGALRVSQLCLALCVAGLACATSGWLPGLALAALLIGLSQGLETPASSALLAQLTPRASQHWVFSVKQTGVQLGGIFAGILFPALLLILGWRAALVSTLIACVLLIVLIGRLRRELEPPPMPHASTFGMREALRLVWVDRVLRRITIASFGFITAQVCMNTFMVTYLVSDLSSSLVNAGRLFAAVQIGGFAGRRLWGALCGRRLRARSLLIGLGCAMTVLGLTLNVLSATTPGTVVLAVCIGCGLTASGWNGIYLAEVARLSPKGEVGRVTGASFLCSSAGLILGPLLFSLVARSSHYGLAYVMTAGFSAIGVAALLLRPSSPAGTATPPL